MPRTDTLEPKVALMANGLHTLNDCAEKLCLVCAFEQPALTAVGFGAVPSVFEQKEMSLQKSMEASQYIRHGVFTPNARLPK